jgi:hypothetical protein
MNALTKREIRRLELRATWCRILARHTDDRAQRNRWIDLAEDEERKIVSTQVEAEAFGEPVNLNRARERGLKGPPRSEPLQRGT